MSREIIAFCAMYTTVSSEVFAASMYLAMILSNRAEQYLTIVDEDAGRSRVAQYGDILHDLAG